MTEGENSNEQTHAADDEEKPRIKVTDRRLFDKDGNLRPEAEESGSAVPSADEIPTVGPDQGAAKQEAGAPIEKPGGPSSPAAADAEGTPGAGAGRDEAAAPRTPDQDQEPADAGRRVVTPTPSAADLPRDFASFVESLYFEAMLFLGAIRHPQTGQTMEDPEMARYKIDILGMLQDKTEGNLDDEEAKLLEDALYQLRMLFVEKTGASATPTQ